MIRATPDESGVSGMTTGWDTINSANTCDDGRIRVVRDSARLESLRPGVVVGGHYLVERELGHGGMGHVFLAEDREPLIASRRKVVLKIQKAKFGDDESVRARFEKEANLLADMRNDGIAECLGAFLLSDGMPVLIMEYVEGETLADFLKSHGGKIDEEMCRELLLPVAGALDYAHESGVFHLDVKPQNIMVRKMRRNGMSTCLLDFGIACGVDDVAASGTYGTPQYMPPESGDRPSAAMDVYSLAVTAYECVTGNVPYPAGWRPHSSISPIGEESPFTCAIMRGLSEFPDERPNSCIALIDPDLDEMDRTTGSESKRPRRRKFPPPPVSNLRVSRVPAANGVIKVEWDWPDDLETCMWAIVEDKVEKLEDVPEEDRRWIARSAYSGYGGVSVPPRLDCEETRSVVVFGVYVLNSANKTFVSKEPASVELKCRTISYCVVNAARGWRRLVKELPVLVIRSSCDQIPEIEVLAENFSGNRKLMRIPMQEGMSVLEISMDGLLRDGERVSIRLPKKVGESYVIRRMSGLKS